MENTNPTTTGKLAGAMAWLNDNKLNILTFFGGITTGYVGAMLFSGRANAVVAAKAVALRPMERPKKEVAKVIAAVIKEDGTAAPDNKNSVKAKVVLSNTIDYGTRAPK